MTGSYTGFSRSLWVELTECSGRGALCSCETACDLAHTQRYDLVYSAVFNVIVGLIW